MTPASIVDTGVAYLPPVPTTPGVTLFLEIYIEGVHSGGEFVTGVNDMHEKPLF